MKEIDKQKRKKQRKLRSKLVKGNLVRPRVVLSKSNRYLIAQAIDDEKGNTLIYLDRTNLIEEYKEKTKNIPQCLKNKEWIKKLGKIMVDKLKEQGIKQVVFDRNGYPYVENGRSDFFCKTIREGGIKV